MTKTLEKAFEAARALPDKDQDIVASVVLTVVGRSKGAQRIDIAEVARKAREEAARNGMTQETFDKILADA